MQHVHRYVSCDKMLIGDEVELPANDPPAGGPRSCHVTLDLVDGTTCPHTHSVVVVCMLTANV